MNERPMRGSLWISSLTLCLAYDSKLNTASQVDDEVSFLQMEVLVPDVSSSLLASSQRYFHVENRSAQIILTSVSPPASLRPSNITKVEFGVRLKHFYGIDFARELWTSDAVIVTRWNDTRNAGLVPDGEAELRLNGEEAAKKIWLPRVKVTNYAHDGVDIISTSVLVSKRGNTTMVQRALLTVKADYHSQHFPFDEQSLEIHVASESYMADQVELEPTQDTNLSGADASLFKVWSLTSSSTFSRIEEDGLLRKSRGVLRLTVKRYWAQFGTKVFLPSNILLAMTWTSLWLPLSAPFTMPRVALNAIALLSQVTLAQRVESMSPVGEQTWLDGYMAVCFSLQFTLLFLNGVVMSLHHKCEDPLGAQMDSELIRIFPCLWVLCFICLCKWPGSAIPVLAVIALAYIASIPTRRQRNEKSNENGEQFVKS